jgi:hypothetical protein
VESDAQCESCRLARHEVMLYNAMVMGEQNYYQIATEISIDLKPIQRNVMTILKNRLGVSAAPTCPEKAELN